MENNKRTRKCAYCDALFAATRTQRFCSRSCARYGSPRQPRRHLENVEAFWARVRRCVDSECWIWSGARNSRGYGFVMFGGIGYTAQALAFRLSHPHVAGRQVRVGQDCGNKLCCNPAHLRARFLAGHVTRTAATPA
jgi:hypothetical protein